MPEAQNRARVIVEVLETCLPTTTKNLTLRSRTMPGLGYTQVLDCLSFAMTWGLLTFVRKDCAYETTAKGREFLKSYRRLAEFIDGL